MSKYNIVINKDDSSIENMLNITVEDFNDVVSGTATQIICEIMDFLTYEDRTKLFAAITRKLAFEGEATIKFINVFKLSKDLIRGHLNSKSLSEIISQINSVFIEADLLDIISKTQNIQINKIYNTNNQIVVVINKTNE